MSADKCRHNVELSTICKDCDDEAAEGRSTHSLQQPGSALTVEELGKLSADLDAYMDWAQTWHKQAGGYTASDTFLTMMRMEKWARLLAELTGKPETPLRKISDAEDANPSRPNE